MNDPLLQVIYFAFGAAMVFAVLVMLRMLSVYREQQIERYELMRQAQALRGEYIRQLRHRGE